VTAKETLLLNWELALPSKADMLSDTCTPVSHQIRHTIEHCVCLISLQNKQALQDVGKDEQKPAWKPPPVMSLLDMASWMSESELCDGGVPFTTIELLMETATVQECAHILEYLEKRAYTLCTHRQWKRGKLILLRTCLELLRRTSRSQHAFLRGRVHILSSSLFPYHDQNFSSQRMPAKQKRKLNSEYLAIECAQRTSQPNTLFPVENLDEDLHQMTWNIISMSQAAHYFTNSSACDTLLSSLTSVLNVFLQKDVSAHNLLLKKSCFEPLRATCAKIVGLQMCNPCFRMGFLMQCIIMLVHLQKEMSLRGDRSGVVDALLERISGCLVRQLPGTAKFIRSIRHSLATRESVWARLTAENFKFSQHVRINPEVSNASGELGNPILSRLWTLSASNVEAIKKAETLNIVPSVQTVYDQVLEDLDSEAGIEEEFRRHKDFSWSWKAFRLLIRSDMHAMCSIATKGLHSAVADQFSKSRDG